ncbi:hypothetical protein B0H10DRAFT_2233887 [Mycena sp. CBHHK59/15]|nr:hypothetical protein B0H10DRAFT_2233887 [Mycena sp. CBHHK59/15]
MPHIGNKPVIWGGRGGPGGASFTGQGGKGGRGEGPRLVQEDDANLFASIQGGIGGKGGEGGTKSGETSAEWLQLAEPLVPPQKLLPTLSLKFFCERYDLSVDIASFLAREGFRTVKALSLVDTYTLEDAGLRKDHIAELKMALAKLLDDYDIGPE